MIAIIDSRRHACPVQNEQRIIGGRRGKSCLAMICFILILLCSFIPTSWGAIWFFVKDGNVDASPGMLAASSSLENLSPFKETCSLALKSEYQYGVPSFHFDVYIYHDAMLGDPPGVPFKNYDPRKELFAGAIRPFFMIDEDAKALVFGMGSAYLSENNIIKCNNIITKSSKGMVFTIENSNIFLDGTTLFNIRMLISESLRYTKEVRESNPFKPVSAELVDPNAQTSKSVLMVRPKISEVIQQFSIREGLRNGCDLFDNKFLTEKIIAIIKHYSVSAAKAEPLVIMNTNFEPGEGSLHTVKVEESTGVQMEATVPIRNREKLSMHDILAVSIIDTETGFHDFFLRGVALGFKDYALIFGLQYIYISRLSDILDHYKKQGVKLVVYKVSGDYKKTR